MRNSASVNYLYLGGWGGVGEEETKGFPPRVTKDMYTYIHIPGGESRENSTHPAPISPCHCTITINTKSYSLAKSSIHEKPTTIKCSTCLTSMNM